jgi:hypothetical protein
MDPTPKPGHRIMRPLQPLPEGYAELLQRETEQQVLQQVTHQVQEDENSWFSTYLVQGLLAAGYLVDEASLSDYAPRLSMRRYRDGTLIIAIDATEGTEHQLPHLGRPVLGLGAPQVSLPGGFKITRPILTGPQAAAYELGQLWPIEPLATDFGADEGLKGPYERPFL